MSTMVRLGAYANSARMTMGCGVAGREGCEHATRGSTPPASTHLLAEAARNLCSLWCFPCCPSYSSTPSTHLVTDGGAQLAQVHLCALTDGLRQQGLWDDRPVLLAVLILGHTISSGLCGVDLRELGSSNT